MQSHNTQEPMTDAEREATLKSVASWDRAMRRAFKGILSSPERRRELARAVKRVSP